MNGRESPIEILSPKVLEAIRRQLGVAHGVLIVLVSEICLKRPARAGRSHEPWLLGPLQRNVAFVVPSRIPASDIAKLTRLTRKRHNVPILVG
jgi:hypothetical protein